MRHNAFVWGLLLALVLSVFSSAASRAKEAEAEPLVRVQEAKDALSAFSDYDEFIADTTEPQIEVLFSTEKGVKDFKVLKIDLNDMGEGDKITFAVKELYALDALTPERPLVVGLTIYGSIPHYGVSYTGEDGTTQTFAVGESGEDGSLFLSEIETTP